MKHQSTPNLLPVSQAVDNADDGPWLGGCSKLTIADITAFDLVDIHLACAWR
jgi:hypothetical protein